jgi:voltage-gated potassium channel
MAKKVAKIKDHFIICGFGVVGEDVINEFVRSRARFLVVDKDREALGKMQKEFPEIIFVEGDATDDEVLKSAGIDKARGIIAVLGNDADNLYICLTARSLNPRLRVIARAIESEAINKLKKAGADYVFSPEKIGGLRLAAAALRPSVTYFLDAVLHGDYYGLTLDEVEVNPESAIVGKKLRQTKISQDIGIVISAIKSAKLEKLVFNPNPDTVIHSGDILIAFGFPEQIGSLKSICGCDK